MQIVIFSKDRAMQLDACLNSLCLNTRTHNDIPTQIIYKTTTSQHKEQYDSIRGCHKDYEGVSFVREKDFKADTLRAVGNSKYIIFVVDDVVFIRPFDLDIVTKRLDADPVALGFSLRLSPSITYSYTKRRNVSVPPFTELTDDVLQWDWPCADGVWAYSLEISTSVYRTNDLMPILHNLKMTNPNIFEAEFCRYRNWFSTNKPRLLCFKESPSFGIPCNRVQSVFDNEAGTIYEYTAQELADKFDEGLRIDVDKLQGFTPTSCQQEVELSFA